MLADEMLRDPHFAAQVAETLGRPQTLASGVTVGSHSAFRGDVAGGSIDRSRRYHVGSMQFGGGGLTALIAVGLIAVSGGGAVAYTVFQEPAEPTQTVEPTVRTQAPIGSTQTPSQEPPAPAKAESSWAILAEGGSTDLGDLPGIENEGDKVADLVSGTSGAVTATGGARIAPLPVSVVPSLATCTNAVEKQPTRTLKNLRPGDIICVITSRDAVAGATVSAVNSVYVKLDYAYWTSF